MREDALLMLLIVMPIMVAILAFGSVVFFHLVQRSWDICTTRRACLPAVRQRLALGRTSSQMARFSELKFQP